MKCLAILLLAAFTGVAGAQVYPSKPVRVVSTALAGAPPDTLLRALTPLAAQDLGQALVVDNRPGANGNVGAQAVARTTPDGHLLLFTAPASLILSRLLEESMPFDPDKDFAPVIHLGELSGVIVAHPSLPAKNWQELVALAKGKPGTVRWGSAGLTSTAHLYREWFARERGLDFFDVPYKTFAQAFNDLLAGEIQVTIFGGTQAVQLTKAGKVRPLAAIGRTRSRIMPDVPTIQELGVDLYLTTGFALFTPTGTPRDVVARLNGTFAKALRDPNVVAKVLDQQGFELNGPAGGPPEALGRFMEEERATYSRLVPLLGLKKQ